MNLETIERILVGGALTVALLGSGTPAGGSPVSQELEAQARAYVLALAGEWEGTLEYADFSDGARVEIGLRVSIGSGDDAYSARMQLVFIEPDGSEMPATESVRLDPANRTYRVGDTAYRIERIEGFVGTPAGFLVWAGTERENGTEVPFREELTLRDGELVIRKETGDPLRFRNEFRLARVR